MKKVINVFICALAFSISAPVFAQQKDSSTLGRKIKNTADTVAVKTKATVKKGTAKIIDKTYMGKSGPAGETVYIDNQSKYYYIDGKGKKIFITKAEMKNKTN